MDKSPKETGRGRPAKAEEELMRKGRFTVNLPPKLAEIVREEADRQCLPQSTYLRQILLKELRRLEGQDEQAV